MAAEGVSVVVIDAGRGRSRSPLATVRALASAGYRVVVATAWPRSLAGSSRWTSVLTGLPADDDPDFVAEVAALRERHDALEVFACSDRALTRLRPELRAIVDKACLSARARACGVPVPPAVTCSTEEEVRAAACRFGLPVVVKPASDDDPAVVVGHEDGLAAVAVGPDHRVVVQPRLNGALTALAGVVVGGEMVAAVQQVAERTWPVDAGVSCFARSVQVDEELGSAVGRLMAGFDGVVEAQFLDDLLIDVNPRPYGSLPLAVAAGVNLPAIWCDVLRGVDVATVRGRPGVRYRWLDADVRAVARAVVDRRIDLREAAGAVRPRRGTVHSVWSARDPGPALARLRHLARRSDGR